MPAQPPSGGCVLKHMLMMLIKLLNPQPPSGGCVLKHILELHSYRLNLSRLRAAVC